MAKQQGLEFEGEVLEVLPAGNFRVRPDGMDVVILCKKSGKMAMNKISLIEWDRVKIEVSPYDMKFGRITFRLQWYSKSTVQAKEPAPADQEPLTEEVPENIN